MSMIMELKYFTLKRAQRLVASKPSSMNDAQLQKHIVILRDFERYLSFPSVYMDILAHGGYYVQLIDFSASGLVPKDPWLHTNISYCLNEATNERISRQTNINPY